MMPYSEDHIALAAEYALGTLDADERAQVETMMSVDKDFAAIVDAWEDKLSVLNQMVGSVEPRAEVWDKIKEAVGHSDPQAPLVLPQAPPVVVPEVKEPAEVGGRLQHHPIGRPSLALAQCCELHHGDRGSTGRDDRGWCLSA